jgi:uncharacterized membrane protein required for colicin V production
VSFVVLMAGCSSYEPHMKVGQKAAEGRGLDKILADHTANLNELMSTISNVRDVQSAQAAAPRVKELYAKWCDLIVEEKKAKQTTTPEQEKEFQPQIARMTSAGSEVERVVNNMKLTLPTPPAELTKALDDGKAAADAAANTDVTAGISLQLVATPPEGSTWMMWVLDLFVLATCVAFLFRDGIWSNAVRLVNIVFAGLLTMNFYEPLAKFITEYSEDIRTWAPFMDFLAFWICFVGFAAILTAITDKVSRVRVRFLQVAERVGGLALSFCIGWIMVCIVLVSLHTAPLGQYPFLGCFQPQGSMYLGMLAPDREWLGFTKYQSEGPVCRPFSANDLKKVAFTDVGEKNFIDQQWKRRLALESYVRGNAEHSTRVNKQFVRGGAPSKPGG